MNIFSKLFKKLFRKEKGSSLEQDKKGVFCEACNCYHYIEDEEYLDEEPTYYNTLTYEQKVYIAKQMLSSNVSASDISQSIGLTISEVIKIKGEL